MPRRLSSQQLDALLHAIAQQESRGNPNALGDRQLKHPAYGEFQMREPAYQDVVQSYPQLGAHPLASVLGHADQQTALAHAYLQVLQDRYHLSTIDQLIEAWNAGPTAVRQGRIPAKTWQYLQEVRARLSQQK